VEEEEKVLAGAVATTAVVTGTLALSEGLKGSDEPKSEPVQKYSGGGFVMPKFPAFKGGGFNFKGMLGGICSVEWDVWWICKW
jgi:hypothetical protein